MSSSDNEDAALAARSLPSEEAITAEARALRSSVRALKGHLTRRIRSARKAVEDPSRRQSSHSAQELLDFHTRIKSPVAKIEEVYSELMAKDESLYMDYSTELDHITDTVDEIIGAIREGLSRMATEPRQGPSAAPGRSSGAASKVKPNRALEP